MGNYEGVVVQFRLRTPKEVCLIMMQNRVDAEDYLEAAKWRDFANAGNKDHHPVTGEILDYE